MTFDQAVEIILSKEGGYVNDPKDSGGETNMGISKRSYPSVDIKNLTKDQAKRIYYKDFWQKIKADELPPKVRLNVFDFAVNAGIGTAIKTLQNAAGVNADGIIGSQTIKAAQKVSARNYAVARLRYYTGLAKRRPKDMAFLDGWLIRTMDITLLSV
jgi:lysozyme family protein